MHTSNKLYPTWWIVLLGSLTALGPLAIDMYLPALPQIAKSFGVTTSTASYSVTAYFIGLVIGQVIYGPVSDRIGRKKPLYFGLSLYIFASLLCAFAPNIESLIAFRTLQALGGCAGVVMARAAIRDTLPTIASAQAFSTLVMVMGLAPILAPASGDFVLRFAGWRMIFLVEAVVALLNLIWVHIAFKDSLSVEKRRYIPVSRILKDYVTLFKDKSFTLPAFGSGCMLGALFVYVSSSAGLIIETFNISPTHFSWIFGVNALGFVFFSQVNARLVRRYRLVTLLSVGAVIQFICVLSMFVLSLLHILNLYLVLALLFVAIATIGITGPNGTALALAKQGEKAGLASALLGSLRFFLGFLGGLMMLIFELPVLQEMSLTMLLLVGTGLFLVWQYKKQVPDVT